MKRLKSVLIVAAFISHGICCAQIKFEKGYFIDTDGKRTECLARNVDWAFNPSFFDYKIDANSPRLRKNVNEVREFAIEHRVKYIAAKVRIDRSSDAMDDNEISISFNPEWKDERIFLKAMVEGDVSLYSYEEQHFLRFFYRIKTGALEQLVYKR